MTRELDVYLDGVRAGQLVQSAGSAVTFSYASEYLSAGSPTPLSLSMPLARERHANRVVTAWLEGLLPDNSAVREHWGRQFGVSPRSAFALLRHVGRDAAGAVQVLPANVDPPDAARRTGEVRDLTEDEVAAMLVTLSHRDAGWEVGEGAGRWSLAGAHNKVALHRLDDGTCSVPMDSIPTTHVLKQTLVGGRFTDLHVNEFVCLRAAGLLGLRVAVVDLVDFGGAKTLVSTRYDRGRTRSGRWQRLHQEDLLQALSIRPEKKYQADGGPGVKSIAGLLSTLSLTDRQSVRTAFFEALAYNALVGGTDAHAKNYSLLLLGDRVAMAPLYDVASYAPDRRPAELIRSSMKLRTAWNVAEATSEDWTQVGGALGLGRQDALARVDRIRRGLPEALARAAAGAPRQFQAAAEETADAIAQQRHLRPEHHPVQRRV